jgi:glutamyl-tRNA synthetase
MHATCNYKQVTSLTGVTAPGAEFKGTRKLNWLAQCADLVPAQLVEFDYLISKDKLEENDELTDNLTAVTRAESAALVDPCMRGLRAGDVVQLERRGFFRCDAPFGATKDAAGVDSPLVLFMIPDGKTSAMSTLTTSLKHV